MKTIALVGENYNQKIIGQVTQNLDDAVLAQLPKLNSLKRKLRCVIFIITYT